MKQKFLALIAIVLSTLFSLIAMELILAYPVHYFFKGESYYSATSNYTEYFLYEEDDFVGFKSTSNINRKFPPKYGQKNAPRRAVFYDYHTNAQGFRYPEDISPNKKNDELRIFSLGGSTTLGAESPDSSTYPQLLENILRREIKELMVVNAAVGSYRSIHLKRYYEKFVRGYHPDIITIYEGWNDFEDSMYGYWAPGNPFGHGLTTQFILYGAHNNDWLRRLRKFALFHVCAKAYFAFTNQNRTEANSSEIRGYLENARSNHWIDEYYVNISALVKEAIADGVTPVLINPASPVFPGATDEIKNFANEDLNMNDRWDGFVIVKNKIYEMNLRIAKENGIPLIELNKIIDKYDLDYKLKFSLFTDRFHPSDEGNRVIAEALAPHLLKIVRDKKNKGKE